MDFYSIIKKINELRNELKQIPLSAIERDIIKAKISETYLLLFEETTDVHYEDNIIANCEERSKTQSDDNDEQSDILYTHQQQKKPLNVDYKSLVDKFLEKESEKPIATEDKSLLSKMSQAKITDLKRSIAMNDRFIFIKELFKNDFDAYNRYINALNGCQSMEQAEQYLAQLKNQYEWLEENETVQHFLSLIGRKFF